jgi:hypothetical protein
LPIDFETHYPTHCPQAFVLRSRCTPISPALLYFEPYSMSSFDSIEAITKAYIAGLPDASLPETDAEPTRTAVFLDTHGAGPAKVLIDPHLMMPKAPLTFPRAPKPEVKTFKVDDDVVRTIVLEKSSNGPQEEFGQLKSASIVFLALEVKDFDSSDVSALQNLLEMADDKAFVLLITDLEPHERDVLMGQLSQYPGMDTIMSRIRGVAFSTVIREDLTIDSKDMCDSLLECVAADREQVLTYILQSSTSFEVSDYSES